MHGLRRLIRLMAASVAIAISIGAPALYLFTAHQYESARISTMADAHAEGIAGFIYTHPALWEFSELRLVRLLTSATDRKDEALRRLFGKDGALLAKVGRMPEAPTLAGVAEISDRYCVGAVPIRVARKVVSVHVPCEKKQ